MDSALTTVGLPIALAIIMFGLGLDLTLADFRRVGKAPEGGRGRAGLPAGPAARGLLRAGGAASTCPPLLGIGMMLLAASPGGTSANLFSHLFRGDVALNITLTAINSVIALVHPAADHRPRDRATTTAATTCRCRSARSSRCSRSCWSRSRSACSCAPAARGFAGRMDRPVRIGSAVILAVLVLGILVDQRENVGDYLADVGPGRRRSSARSAWSSGTSCRGRSASSRTRRSPRRWRSACTTRTLAIFVAVEVLDEHRDLGPGRGLLALHVRLRRPLGHRSSPAVGATACRPADQRA